MARLTTAATTFCALLWTNTPVVFSAPDCLADPQADACSDDPARFALESDVETSWQGAGADHLKLLQRQAVAGTDRAASGDESSVDDSQPFWRMKERMQEEEQQQQQQQQQQQHQQQQQQQQGPEPELTKAINEYLHKNVVSMLNEGLPEMVKNQGLDPMPQVVQEDRLMVTALTGMSAIKVEAFALKSMTLKLDTSSFTGSASFGLRAAIPAMTAKVSREGMLGLGQHYQLSVAKASLAMGLEGSLSLREGKVHIGHASAPKSSVQFSSMHLTSQDAPRFELRRLTRQVEDAQQAIQGKVAADLKKAVLGHLSKMLPISLNLTMLV